MGSPAEAAARRRHPSRNSPCASCGDTIPATEVLCVICGPAAEADWARYLADQDRQR